MSASAAEKYFTNKLVDSNSYTFITAPLKESTVSTALVRISAINPVDGSGDTYNYLWIKILYGGSGTKIKKGTYYDIQIPDYYLHTGINVPLYAMGNNSSKDCRIDGYWNVH